MAELSGELSVSGETIRRDIKDMARRGLLERVHGGAVLPNLIREPAFQRRLGQNAEAKRIIAQRVAQEIRNGDSLMLDTGTTTSYVARSLIDHSDLLVVTNSTDVARTLASRNRNRVYLCGGEARADDGAVFGSAAIDFIRQFRVEHAILSIAAVSERDGLLDFHVSEASYSRAVIGQARRTFVVADHSKFESHAPVRVCGFEMIDALVTDRHPSKALADKLTASKVAILVAK